MVTVSVLIRTIGRQAALKDALESLRNQNFQDFETVIVEDGPETLTEFLKTYSDLRIHYEALGVNKGRSAAGNWALALAQGEYCLFLDEDDALFPDHLRTLVQGAQGANRAIAYSWSEERKVERASDGSITRRGRKRTRYERFSLLHMIAGNFIPINAVLFRRAIYDKAGGFDEDIDCLEDWLLWLRFTTVEPDWLCVPRVTAIYNVPFDLSARRRAFHQWHDKVHERMQGIRAAWPIELLNRDMRHNFRVAIFLRKLYYYLNSYL